MIAPAPRPTVLLSAVLAVVLFLLESAALSIAQSTVGTGSIVGTVSDPSGAIVQGAVVAITNVATGQTVSLVTNSAGSFSSGALIPGNYKTQISAKGFGSVEVSTVVLLGNTATVNVSLPIGQETHVVEVQGSEIRVNTEEPTVQGILHKQRVENLPVTGRNFRDFAQ